MLQKETMKTWPLYNMQNLFLFSAEYQVGRVIHWNIILYFVSCISLFPVNPWRWLTGKIEGHGLSFLLLVWLWFLFGGEGRTGTWEGEMGEQGTKRPIDSPEAEGVVVNKIRDSVSNENTYPLPGHAVGRDNSQRESYTWTGWNTGSRISCLSEHSFALSDRKTESTSANYMGWDNGHFSSQFGTHRFIGYFPHTYSVLNVIANTVARTPRS